MSYTSYSLFSRVVAVEALSKCPLTSRGQEELASAAVDGLILYLKKECELVSIQVGLTCIYCVCTAHPATQLTTVGTLAAYCELFYSSVPSTLFQHLKVLAIMSTNRYSPFFLRIILILPLHILCEPCTGRVWMVCVTMSSPLNCWSFFLLL